jgi:hypothetical protein
MSETNEASVQSVVTLFSALEKFPKKFSGYLDFLFDNQAEADILSTYPAGDNGTQNGDKTMSKTQMIAALKKMQIADAVDVTYCNVLKSYELKVYFNDRCIRGNVRTRAAVVAKAEQWYCDLVSRSY